MPAWVLLELMVLPTLRAAVTQAGQAACLVRDVVLVVTGGGGPSATRPGAGGVSDLGQVAELDPGIMAFGLEPVVTLAGIDRVEADQQIRPGSRDAEPPGPWFGSRGEGEARAVPDARSGPLPVALGLGARAAVGDGVPLPVGHGHAPRRPRVGGGGRQVSPSATGQPARVRPSHPADPPSRSAWPAAPSGRPARRTRFRDWRRHPVPAGSPGPGAGPGRRGRAARPCRPRARPSSAPAPRP